MKKIILSIAFTVGALAFAGAQHTHTGACGTSYEDQVIMDAKFEADRLISQPSVSDRGVIRYVPIHFHLVADGAGVGRIKEMKVLDQLCDLNESYGAYDVQFYLSPHPTHGLFDKSINHDGVYTDQSNTFLMQNRRHANAVNIFVVNVAESGNNQPGVTLAYYSPPRDWVVSKKSEISGNGNGTIPHEVGHFFSLKHTFFGWESGSFTSTSPGWPVAPPVSPAGVPTELVDGSNCLTAGDGICDTPPDYNFGFGWSGCTPYTGGAQDPTGVLVDPMENNFMSYFIGCNPYQFTQGQIDVVKQNLDLSSRNYLDNTYSPVGENVESPDDLILNPPNNETVPFYNSVKLEWLPVTGASHYLVEIDRTSGYGSPSAQLFIMTETSKELYNLAPNTTYYWRVRPFNYSSSCAVVKQRILKTNDIASDLNEINYVQDIKLAPNPVENGGSATLSLNAAKAFEANVTMVDALGRQVADLGTKRFESGENLTEIPTESLANGLYFVVLESDLGRNVMRLAVLR